MSTRLASLEVVRATKAYRNKQVLHELNLSFGRGEVVAITGENGCGKSTLLKMCAGLITPDSGSVNRHVSLGYCPQDPGLLPRLTIDEHLSVFGTGVGMGPGAAIRRGRELLESLGVGSSENGRLGNLSGGTRQKVNLALALIEDPELLLLDEPYQGFDHGTYVNFWDLVDGWRQAGKSVVVITHLLTETARADRLIVMRPIGHGTNIESETWR
jgi:ABC-2 type transport system ATP-binding protein